MWNYNDIITLHTALISSSACNTVDVVCVLIKYSIKYMTLFIIKVIGCIKKINQ